MTFSRLGRAASTAALLITPPLARTPPQVVVAIKPNH
jgi:hypothetical protein